MIPAVSVQELAREIQNVHQPFLLDVREAYERAISRLEDQLHIPMGELPSRIQELDPQQDIVVYCKSGIRSAYVVQYLQQLGFCRVRNLSGGINTWASEVDPSMQTY